MEAAHRVLGWVHQLGPWCSAAAVRVPSGVAAPRFRDMGRQGPRGGWSPESQPGQEAARVLRGRPAGGQACSTPTGPTPGAGEPVGRASRGSASGGLQRRGEAASKGLIKTPRSVPNEATAWKRLGAAPGAEPSGVYLLTGQQ